MELVYKFKFHLILKIKIKTSCIADYSALNHALHHQEYKGQSQKPITFPVVDRVSID